MITTKEDARTAIIAKLETLRLAWTDYPLAVEYDNFNTVNLATQSEVHAVVSIVYNDGFQVDLSSNPTTRAIGTIVIEVRGKEGTGMSKVNALLEYLYRAVQMSDSIPPVRTYAARFGSKPVKEGWVTEAALIPFWYDSTQR